MDVEIVPGSYMDDLYDSTEEKVTTLRNFHHQHHPGFCQVASAVLTLKNSVIGSQRAKDNIIEQGLLARLIHLLVDPEITSKIKTDVVYILGSIINGSESNFKSLTEADISSLLLGGVTSPDPKLVCACLCCLQSVVQYKTPVYTDHDTEPPSPQCQVIYSDPGIVPHLISLLETDTSATQQIAVCNILSCCCRSVEQQNSLVAAGVLGSLSVVLSSHLAGVELAGLQCLATIVYSNPTTGLAAINTQHHGKSLVSQVIQCTGRENCVDTQLAAARVLTCLYRLGVLPDIEESEGVITYRVLPCLVKTCKKEETTVNRIIAAETLAYLIEVKIFYFLFRYQINCPSVIYVYGRNG